MAGLVVGGSAITYNGTQINKEQLLGISEDARANAYIYDARTRVARSVFAREDVTDAAIEHLTAADFRTKLERTSTEPQAPPSLEFGELAGHRIGSVKRGSADPVTFAYTGAERWKDERFEYEYDSRGRIIKATELPNATMTVRRIHYDYSATDRIVGRKAEYAVLSTPATPPLDSAWKAEDRGAVIADDGLPADTTFVWDPISDRLVAVYKSGASANPSIDANGGLLRQILHGADGYDDPVEVAISDGLSAGVNRLYPIFNEAGNGALQLIVNANGEVASRTILEGAYGEDEFGLAGAAVDRMEITRTRDSSGNLASVDVSIRLTEAIDSDTLAIGARLAAVNGAVVVRTSPVAASLSAPNTLNWSLSAAQWTALTDPAGEVDAISIAVTSALRAQAWGDSVGILPPPDWSSNPKHSSAALPVEYRASLTFLATTLAGTEDTTALYEAPSLSALGGPVTPASRFLMASAFQALPFAEPATGLVYARARWYDPNSGSFLTPDPRGYEDSSNLYAFAGGDPINKSDPTGKAASVSRSGVIIGVRPDGSRYRIEPGTDPVIALRILESDADLGFDEQEDILTRARMPIPYSSALRPGEYAISSGKPNYRAFTHEPKGDNWVKNAIIATSGLPPQNRQQQLVQGGLQIAGTAAMIKGTYAQRGTVRAEVMMNYQGLGPITVSHAEAEGMMLPHRNRLDATGPHDVYAIVDVQQVRCTISAKRAEAGRHAGVSG